MADKGLEINLFGACVVRSNGETPFEINGAKHKALFALLATAPFGRRTRTYLQETLWGTACYDTGRQSLRRALSDIKRIMGPAYEELLNVTNSEITLDLNKVSHIGRPGSAEFLEGLNVREAGFVEWAAGIRLNPNQVYSLYSPTNQQPPKPIVPTIAVLPFRMVGGSDDRAVLGDWLAEEVSRSLSRSNLLAVISHLSSREIVKHSTDIGVVRAQLAADYCVSGSLRSFDDTLILDADFIDTRTGRIMWTRQFEGNHRIFLSGAAEGVTEIVRAIGSSIASEAIKHVSNRRLQDLEDHRPLIAGVGLMHRPTLRDFAQSKRLIEEAVRRAPAAAEVHAWYGKWHILSVFNGWTTDAAKDTKIATDSTARALDIDPQNAFCLTIDGFAQNNLLRRSDIASERYDVALKENPNESLSWLLKGAHHAFIDDAKIAVAAAEKARKLSPIDPFGYFYDSLSATAYLAGENYQKALDFSESSLAQNNRHLSTIRAKITALHNLDRGDEAREAAAELIRRQPSFTVSNYLSQHPAADNKLGRTVAEAMAASGIS